MVRLPEDDGVIELEPLHEQGRSDGTSMREPASMAGAVGVNGFDFAVVVANSFQVPATVRMPTAKPSRARDGKWATSIG